MPKVSVIIPVYNAEKYLRECLDSVVNQTLKDIEIICVNDGSTDNSLKILEEYASNDNRIKIINQDNQGAGIARNNGIKQAHGYYLYFLDSDDYIEIDALKKLYTKAQEYNTDIIIFNYSAFDNETGKEQFRTNVCTNISNSEVVFSKLDHENNFFQITDSNVWAKFYRREFINHLNIKFSNTKSVNDVFFCYSTLFMAQRILCLNDCFAYYRRNIKTSLTLKSINSNIKNCFKVFNDLYEFLINKGLSEPLEGSFIERFISCVCYYLKQLHSD